MATTPIWGIAYRGPGELGWPINQITEEMALSIEAVLTGAGGLRHAHRETATDLALVGTGNADAGDGLCTYTGTYPPSGIVSVSVYIRGNVNAATNAIMAAGFEIRDTNSSGTIRYAFDGNKRAEIPRNPSASVTGVSQYSETITGLPTSGTMFIRPIYIASNGATATYTHRTLDIIPSP